MCSSRTILNKAASALPPSSCWRPLDYHYRTNQLCAIIRPRRSGSGHFFRALRSAKLSAWSTPPAIPMSMQSCYAFTHIPYLRRSQHPRKPHTHTHYGSVDESRRVKHRPSRIHAATERGGLVPKRQTGAVHLRGARQTPPNLTNPQLSNLHCGSAQRAVPTNE